MNCPNCNSKIINDSTVTCPSCGANLFGFSPEVTGTVNYQKIHDGYAWLFAFSPLLLIILNIVLKAAEIDSLGASLATVVYVVIMIADRLLMKDNGIKLPISWIIAGAFIPPAYLFGRASALKRSYAPAIVSTIVYGGILLIIILFAIVLAL